MIFVYAFLIAGCICALTQLLADLKIPFAAVALILMVGGGALLTYCGFFSWLESLSAGGPAVTAMGCGNGAYSAGTALASAGTVTPLLLTAGLNIALVAMGALCGPYLKRKFPKIFDKKK